MNICLSGYYFAGSRGDRFLRNIISKDLKMFGKVKIINCDDKNYKDVVDWCDVFVLGGGSLITRRGIGGYSQVKYAKEKGKKIMFYAQTIENGDENFADMMKAADMITVRDEASFRLCERLGYYSVLSADPVVKKFREKTVHVGLREWIDQDDNFINNCARTLDNLVDKGYKLILTPFTTKRTDTVSDAEFSRVIRKSMKHRLQIKNFDESKKPDLYIGMRYHSLLSSIMRSIPVIAINYDPKIRYFMEDSGIAEFLVGYDGLMRIPDLADKILRTDALEREKMNIACFKNLMGIH